MKKILEFLKKIYNWIVKGLSNISGKTWMVIILIIALFGFGVYSNKRYKKLNNDYLISMANEKAYLGQLQDAEGEIRVFQFTIEELENSNDSIMQQLVKSKEKLKVKDKEIKQMQYQLNEFQHKDTVRIVDTIFKDPELHIDTIIGDEWMSNHLELIYPNTVCLETNVKSEKEVFMYLEKETMGNEE